MKIKHRKYNIFRLKKLNIEKFGKINYCWFYYSKIWLCITLNIKTR
jgi:hypothetical protein